MNRKGLWLIGTVLFIGVVYIAMQLGGLHTGAQFGVWVGILGVALLIAPRKNKL